LQPAILEALVHLTLGGPMPAYHGGHLHVAVRYFDIDGQRPGLPADVAALVEKIAEESIELTLVNTSESSERNLVVQAGAFGEHEIVSASAKGGEEIAVGGNHLQVNLPAGTKISITLKVNRFANKPSYEGPFAPAAPLIPTTIKGRDL